MKKVNLHIKDGKVIAENGKEFVLARLEDLERLQEQLKEANEVIKFYANSQIGKKNKDGTCGFWLCSGDVAFDNPLERINNKMKYTCYDPRPAKKWLKKWGVK